MFHFRPLLLAGIRIITCLMLITDPSNLLAEKKISRTEAASSEALNDRTDWFGTYYQGNKCGWARVTREKLMRDGKTLFVVEMELSQKINSLGEIYEDYMLEHLEFRGDSSYSLVGGEYQRRQNNPGIRIKLEKRGDEFLAEINDNGEKRVMIIPTLDFSLLDQLTIEDWIRSNPSVGQQLSVLNFSLRDLKESIDTYQVVYSGEKIIGGNTREVLETTLESSLRGEMGRITFDTGGRALAVRQGGSFEMRLETESRARETETSADFFGGGTVNIDCALGASPTDIASLVLEVTGEESRSLSSGPGLSVDWDARTNSCRAVTGHGRTPWLEATPEEISENLQGTLNYPIHDSEVRDLALDALNGAINDRDKVRNLIAFIDSFLGRDTSPQILTVKETIHVRKGDCSERAALLVTLSRASGVPAREVHGLMYTSDLLRCFAGHSWCEVVLDGVWVAVDPTWRQICVDGTHIRFDSGEKGLAQVMRMTGGLTFRVVEVELAEPSTTCDPRHEKAPESREH